MNELTLEQAKETLQLQAEVLQKQTMEIGALSTERILLGVQLERRDKKIKELESALKGMVDTTKEQEDAK